MPNLLKLLLSCFFIFFISKTNAQQINKADTGYKSPQDSTLTRVPDAFIPYRYQGIHRRSPLLAFFLSAYVPGAGQVYNKQYLKAGTILFVESVSFIAAVGVSANKFEEHKHTDVALALTPFFAAVAYAVIDAPISAERLNEKYGLGRKKHDFSSLHISPNLMNEDGNKMAFGFSLVLQ